MHPTSILLSVTDLAFLLNESERTVRYRCTKLEYRAETERSPANGGLQYRIHLSSLRTEAQAKYWIQQYHDTFPHDAPREQRFAWFNALNLDPEGKVFRPVFMACGLHIDPRAWTDEESDKQHGALFHKKTFAKETARSRAQLVRGFVAATHRAPRGQQTEAGRLYAQIAEVSYPTLCRWHKAVSHLELKDWEPALTPGWHGGRQKVEIHPEMWNFIQCQYLVVSQPTAKSVYQRACRLAAERGWPVPSYRIALARIRAIDRPLRVLKREGETALDNLFPGIIRDYSTFALNEEWCSDGRKGDVFCIWPDGHVGRPHVVSWIDARSRVVLGWHGGKSESIEEVRISFRNAVQRFNCLPQSAYLDNGMGYAGKQFTGGQPHRNRFKFKQTEVVGILTLCGVSAKWALPGKAKGKYIESQHNTHARGTDRRAEFTKAYCGKDTLSRPEGSNPKDHPIPIADYMAAFAEETEAYNLRPHRGVGMDGKSPMQVFTELQAVTVARTPTSEQLAWCMLVSQSVMLNKRDASFVINGNVYWDSALPKLPSTGPYIARYDGDDSRVPVHLFDGERFVCKADLRVKTGGQNQAAYKDGIRAKNAEKRLVKDLSNAIKDQQKARRWDIDIPPADAGAVDVVTMPAPKVVTPLRPSRNFKPVIAPSEKVSPEQLAQFRLNETANLAAREAKFAQTGFINLPRQAGSKR